MKKRGQIGEGILMIYRLLMISVIAVVVFGVSSVSYDYEIDVRDAEARILAHEISECLVNGEVLDLNKISEEDYGGIASYCGLGGSDRFYIGVDVRDSSGKKMIGFYEGDSGSLWIKDLFAVTENAIVGENFNINKYNPGYFKFDYPVFILKDGVKSQGKIEMEVLVNYDSK